MAIDIASTLTDLVKTGVAVFAVNAGRGMYEAWKKSRDTKLNNLDTDYDRTKQVVPLLESIKYELSADRVWESAFSNGDVTFSGIHMKKLSVVAETDHESPLSAHFQLVPLKQFARNMDILYTCKEDHHVFQEHNKMDDLSALNKRFHLLTILCIKIRDDRGRWIGLLNVSWTKPHRPTADDIAYALMMAARIPTKTKK